MSLSVPKCYVWILFRLSCFCCVDKKLEKLSKFKINAQLGKSHVLRAVSQENITDSGLCHCYQRQTDSPHSALKDAILDWGPMEVSEFGDQVNAVTSLQAKPSPLLLCALCLLLICPLQALSGVDRGQHVHPDLTGHSDTASLTTNCDDLRVLTPFFQSQH